MCINDKVSILAFMFCSFTCLFLYKRNKRNDKWVCIMFGYLGLMQLLEYLMWIDQDCNGLNQFATDLGFVHNILQPIISLLVAFIFIKNIPIWQYSITMAYLLYSLPKIWESKKTGQCSKPCSKDEIGLSWKYTNTEHATIVWLIFTLALSSPFLLMKKNGIIYFLLFIITYIISHFIAVNRCKNSIIPSNGSWWCLMATLIPFMALFINN